MTNKQKGRLEAKCMSLQNQVTAWKGVAKALAAKVGRLQAKLFIARLKS